MSALRDSHARRLLETTYGYLAVQGTYSRGGAVLFSGLLRITVNDAEQTLDGQKVETDLKGFNLRLRRYLMDEGFSPAIGDQVELEEPFEGYALFHVDGAGHSFGRGGYQFLAGLTPVPSIATSSAAAKPKGLNLA